jgi:hypothetical protein
MFSGKVSLRPANDRLPARRVYEYRSKLWMHSELSSLRNPRWVERYLALCAQNRREQDVERAEFIDEGKSPDPPPNWDPVTVSGDWGLKLNIDMPLANRTAVRGLSQCT